MKSRAERRDHLRAGLGGLLVLGTLGPAGLQSVAAMDGDPKRSKAGSAPDRTTGGQAVESAQALSDVPAAEIRALRRLTFGYRHDDLAQFNSLGANFDERLEAWVDEQLGGYEGSWPPTNDPDLMEAVNASPTAWETLDDSLATLWQERARADVPEEVRDLPVWELTSLMALRAVYSRWQLAEVLADFWHVHFNIDTKIGERRTTIMHFDRDVIRTHMLGNFRAMLEAVTKSNAMMHYLDQLWNTQFGPNENYARELQELYTLGAVHSWGFTPENEIPNAEQMPGSSTTLPPGLKAGYSERDVRSATLALTGWTIDRIEITGNVNEDGGYLFYPDWHDPSPKRILGIEFSSSGEAEVHELLDLLAMHPNTARYVCWKLCRRLVNDDPPEALVERAAELFNDQWQAPDQLEQVVRLILLSPEFKDPANWGSKVKKPFELLCGVARSCGGFNVNLGAWDSYKPSVEEPSWSWWEQDVDLTFTRDFYWGLFEAGALPFRWTTPDGYPETKAAWLASSPLVLGWKQLNRWFNSERPVSDPPGTSETFFPVDAVQTTRSEVSPADRTPSRIVDFWVQRVLGFDATQPTTPQLDASVRADLVAFMQQDAPGPDTPLDLEMPLGNWNDIAWQAFVPERLQTLVATIGMLPDNLLR